MIYLIIILAALTRLVPHIPNVGVVTAVAIFAGSVFSVRKALGVTFFVRLLSDIAIGFFAWKVMVAVYVAHLFGVLFGKWVASSKSLQARWVTILGSGLGAACLFFLITNFAFLYAEYPHTVAGILESYTNGLPFLRGTVIGDVGFSFALFLVYDTARALAPWSPTRQLRLAKSI